MAPKANQACKSQVTQAAAAEPDVRTGEWIKGQPAQRTTYQGNTQQRRRN